MHKRYRGLSKAAAGGARKPHKHKLGDKGSGYRPGDSPRKSAELMSGRELADKLYGRR